MIQNIKTTESLSVNGNLDKKGLENTLDLQPIPTKAWFILGVFSLVTLFGFLILDPDPNLLLSVSVAANVAIMGWAILRLFRLNLLLSPMMIIYVGPLMLVYYSWGNLGSRIAGDLRFASNSYTLEYYPLVALLSTIGLILYCWVVFGVFQKSFIQVIKYQDLYWQPQQVLGAVFLVFAIVAYLSLKYSFTGGYFRGAESNFDRWLIAAMNAFVFLIVLISVSLLARSTSKRNRIMASLAIALSFGLALGLRSRAFVLMVLMLTILCWLTLKPRQARLSFFILAGMASIILFSLGSVIKTIQSGSDSIWENLSVAASLDSSEFLARTSRGIEFDPQYRAGGFEYPASILRCLDYGATPAYGEGILGAFYQGLPGFLRPAGSYSERGTIALHFWKYCLFYDDSISIPLVSGIGDWGMPGVFIYIIFGMFSVVLWRVAQRTPRFFIAYLLVPFFPDYLFWDGLFTYIKTIVFMWLILWILGSILMPRWQPSTSNSSVVEKP